MASETEELAEERDDAQTVGLTALAATHLFAPMRTRRRFPAHRSDWCEPITTMIDVGYAFSDTSFADDGCLFRGIIGGVGGVGSIDGLSDGCGVGERDSHLFERVFGVRFVSHALDDALGVCGSIGAEGNNALIVMSAAGFKRANEQGLAATLSIGDFGHVFRYPFIAEPLRDEDIRLIVLGQNEANRLGGDGGVADRLFVLDCDDRRRAAQTLAQEFRRRGISEASLQRTGRVPKKSDLAHAERDSAIAGEASA